MSLIGTILRMIVENSASKTSLDALCRQLEETTDEISGRMTRAADTPANRAQAGHIIGMERWGSHRLRAALENPNAALVRDEYDTYRPPEDLPISGLVQEFLQARAETIELVDAARDQQDLRVLHNDLGKLSVRGWLSYLNSHAVMEAKRLK